MEAVETRVSKSSFSGIKGAKKERKFLEESSTSYLGAWGRRFESCHPDQGGCFGYETPALFVSGKAPSPLHKIRLKFLADLSLDGWEILYIIKLESF